MVEDALGLKLYQHKKVESERKLEETGINIEKTKSLRREIAPHINFLRQQVEKIEKARELKDELAHKLNEYLAREHAWITQEDARLLDEKEAHEHELKQLTERLREASSKRGGGVQTKVADMQNRVARARNEALRGAQTPRRNRARTRPRRRRARSDERDRRGDRAGAARAAIRARSG